MPTANTFSSLQSIFKEKYQRKAKDSQKDENRESQSNHNQKKPRFEKLIKKLKK
jgi:hypothetical protein